MDWKRDDELKKIFIPARHGLGDQIASFFLPIQYKKPNPNVNILKRVKYGLKHGLLDEAMVIYEEGYNPCGWQLYAYLDFIISTKRTYCFADVPDQANNNWMPDKISSGHINVMTCPPTEFLQLPTTEIVEPAERRPPFSIPSNDYILFNDSAAGQDRRLTNHQIYKDLRVLGMPIVRVGAGYAAGYGNCSATECDLDLVDKTTIPEIFWLARHAKLIVSALSFYRVFMMEL